MTTTRMPRRGNPAVALLVPACFLTAPFVTFLAHNADAGIEPWQVLRYPAFALLPLLAAIALTWLFAGRATAERLAAVLAAVLIAFFNYGALSDGLELMGVAAPIRLVLWVVVATLLAGLAFALSRGRSLIRFLSVVGVFLVGLALVQYAASARPGAAIPPASAPPGAAERSFQSTPDIYYIVPDAYGRADLLADDFGFDNSTFLDALRERGFRVVDDALAHYPVTYLSMASTLDMDYVVEPGEDALRSGREPFYDRLRGGSVLHGRLEREGYVHVSAPPGTWSGTDCSGAEDLCIEPVSNEFLGQPLGEAEWELAHLTPVGELIDTLFADVFPRPFADPAQVVRTVAQADLSGSPVFVQMHLLQTHTPFLFDRECRRTDSQTGDLRRWRDAGRAAYVEAIECANRQLLSAIDLMDDDAIVVILADHGPGFSLGVSAAFEDWNEGNLRERYSVLSAYRLPQPCREMPTASPVNVFRVVVACLEGTQPELLPDRWFYAGYTRQLEVREMRRPPWTPPDSGPGSSPP